MRYTCSKRIIKHVINANNNCVAKPNITKRFESKKLDSENRKMTRMPTKNQIDEERPVRKIRRKIK